MSCLSPLGEFVNEHIPSEGSEFPPIFGAAGSLSLTKKKRKKEIQVHCTERGNDEEIKNSHHKRF